MVNTTTNGVIVAAPRPEDRAEKAKTMTSPVFPSFFVYSDLEASRALQSYPNEVPQPKPGLLYGRRKGWEPEGEHLHHEPCRLPRQHLVQADAHQCYEEEVDAVDQKGILHPKVAGDGAEDDGDPCAAWY